VKSKDPSEFRIYRDKIDLKHARRVSALRPADRPLVGIKLDNTKETTQRRQTRDRFMKQIFQAAGLPLVRIPMEPAYSVNELMN
jgi:hypothetical protein